MNKKSVLFILLDLIFLAVFNTVFFVTAGAHHPISVWISYGFIHFSYIMVLATFLLIRKGCSAVIFGMSLHTVSAGYFFTEFAVGIVFLIIRSKAYKAALIVQIIIAAIYAVMLIANLIANEYTADSTARSEKETAYIKSTAARVKALIDKPVEKSLRKQVEDVYDLLHSSPARSDSSLASVEGQITAAVSDLENAVSSGDGAAISAAAQNAKALIEERSRILRQMN